MIFGVLMLGFDLLAGVLRSCLWHDVLGQARTWLPSGSISATRADRHAPGLGLNGDRLCAWLACSADRTVYFISRLRSPSSCDGNSWRISAALTAHRYPGSGALPGISLGGHVPFYYLIALLVVAYLVARRIVNSHFDVCSGHHQNEARVNSSLQLPVHDPRVFLISAFSGPCQATLIAVSSHSYRRTTTT
jgi:hypothetical protein